MYLNIYMEDWYLVRYRNNMKNLRYRWKILFYLLVSLLIIACTHKTYFSPNELPVARFGQSYYAEITIHSAPGPVIQESFKYLIKPENSGLVLKPLDTSANFPYNNLKIVGIPNTIGEVIIQFGGTTCGTSFPGRDFDKTYIIKVKGDEK